MANIRDDIELLKEQKALLEASAESTRRFGFEVTKNTDRQTVYLKKLQEIRDIEQNIIDIERSKINLTQQLNNLSGTFTNAALKQLGIQNQINDLKVIAKTNDEDILANGQGIADILQGVLSGELDHLAIREKGINLGGKAKQLAEEIADAVENNPGMMKVFAVKASLLNSIEGVLGATLQTAAGLLKSLGPIGLVAILIGKIIEKIADFVKGTIEIRQNLGVNIVQAGQLSARMEMAATKTALMGGNAQTAKDLIGGLVEEFGTINEAAGLSSGNVASLATQIGLGGKETAKLLKVMSDVSGETLDSLANQLLFEDSLSEAAGIPTSLVMAQVAENTELFARAGRDGADELFRAARAAADLGTNLNVVESIADNILDIESSLAAQMEAEMLIGRELNLDRARQLAQQNDIEELTREIQSLAGGPQAFANLGRIEQNALANAIGGISIAQLTPFLGGNAGAGAVSGEEQVKVATDQLSAANTTNKILGSVDGKLDALIEATDRNTKEQRRSR